MTKLYGIVEYLGECKETDDISLEIKEYISNDRFSIDKYKAFKPLSTKNGVRVFKGFADANTLASISKTNAYYQRAIVSYFKKFGDLYEAFVKYDIERQRKRCIFVAMEFEQNYKAVYKSAIENVIQRIKGRNNHIDLDLMDIMEQKGDVVIPTKDI